MTTSLGRSLEFFYFDAGGGHRSAAIALKDVIAERYPRWHVTLVNLQEVLRSVDPMLRVTRMSSEDVYNKYLKIGLTYGSRAFLRGLQRGIRLNARGIELCLEEHWKNSSPDLVVSLIPNFNGVMFRALRRVHPETPYVTQMTDLADVPPNFWQERQDQFMICGNEMAVRQAFLKGYPADHVFQTSGMIIRPDFYRATLTDRGSGREALGLDPDLPTALIMFGGYGSKTSVAIVDQLRRSGLDVQSIVMCGHNEKLRRELQGRALCHATGFTGAVPHYMHLADFFIGKPGPGSVSEAIQMGLPVIVERNRRTMVQELHNATWIEQQNLGIAISSFRKLPEAVKALVREGRLEQFRGNARRVNNRAVYEIPEIFNAIMRGADKTGRQDLPGAHIIHPALRSPGTRHPGVSRG